MTLRERVHEIIFESDTKLGKWFDIALIVSILVSVFVVILSTMSWAGVSPWRGRFLAIEWVFTVVFTIEYIARLWSVKRPLKYAFSFFGVIDLLAILPSFIGLFVYHGETLLVIRTLRLLRVFRVLKLARYLSEATALKRAFILSRHKIIVFLTMVMIVVVIAGALMHVVEGLDADGNPTQFHSMPSAMYWAIITMTTVGYGDMTPSTGFGRFLTAALVLIGYSMIIVPTGILSAEIAQQRRPVAGKSCSNCLYEGHDVDAIHCKRCGQRL